MNAEIILLRHLDFFGMTDFRMGDGRTIGARNEFASFPVILLEYGAVFALEISPLMIRILQHHRMLHFVEEIQSQLAGLPEGGIRDDIVELNELGQLINIIQG